MIEGFAGLIDRETKKMKLVSVAGQSLPPGAKDAMAKMLDDAWNRLQFPARPLKIGDVHTQRQKALFDIPMPGHETTAATMVTTYTLKKIVTPLAFFDVRTDCEIASEGLPSVSAACSGTGSLQFDVQERIPREYLLSMDMTLEVATPETRNSVKSRWTTTIEYMTR
ncbi:MAG: hypothetical protein A4E57_04497 [Syntrophorhabdaceae bacterium PtaU1.Bin034]|nr:MAG: hypothetical protein A4E57_04497 [Syntrophorhabdaceae bacterium PtaU1.Bin034]